MGRCTNKDQGSWWLAEREGRLRRAWGGVGSKEDAHLPVDGVEKLKFARTSAAPKNMKMAKIATFPTDACEILGSVAASCMNKWSPNTRLAEGFDRARERPPGAPCLCKEFHRQTCRQTDSLGVVC